MAPRQKLFLLAAILYVLSVASPAAASFHLMQIEQAIGGVCGDRSVQAVQLRMRAAGQHLVAGAKLIAHDSAGFNPVTLITFPANVDNSAAGSRVLAATAEFAAASGLDSDFALANPIPLAYLAAGKLTFESGGGIVYWSLAWGGAAYTGSNAGSTTNDADGNFNPPFADALPSNGDFALRFTGSAGAMSTNNAADYAPSDSPAIFTNNSGTEGTAGDCVHHDGFESG